MSTTAAERLKSAAAEHRIAQDIDLTVILEKFDLGQFAQAFRNYLMRYKKPKVGPADVAAYLKMPTAEERAVLLQGIKESSDGGRRVHSRRRRQCA
jgi:hypothetical protein